VRLLLPIFHGLTPTGRLLVQERRALALSLQPLETMRRLLSLRLSQLSGLSQTMSCRLSLLSRQLSGLRQAMSHHLHMRQLSRLSQTLCRRLNLRQPLGPNQTISCHLLIRPLQFLVRQQSFLTRHRLTSRIRGRLRKKLANGSTVLSAQQLLPNFLSSIQIGSYLPHRECRHAQKSDLCTKDGPSLTLQKNLFDLI
jgi:hypothetical protein